MIQIPYLLQKLLAAETVHIDGKQNQAIEIIHEYFKLNHENVFITRTQNNSIQSIIISNHDNHSYDLVLVGHVDVVDASYPNAFEPFIKDGKVYARGASDMKGTVWAMIKAFEQRINNQSDSNLKVALLISSDEEIGGMNGIGYLVNNIGVKAKVAFVPDGGDNWKLVTGEKGTLHINIDSKGLASHGSRPWLGEHAGEKLINQIMKFQTWFKDRYGVATLQDNWIPTANIGSINFGQSANKVPELASAKIDLRFTSSNQLEDIKLKLNEFFNVPELDLSFSEIALGSPTEVDTSAISVQKWIDVCKEANRELTTQTTSGASDARWFTDMGADIVISKPTCSAIHIDDEWIDLEELNLFKSLITKWINTL